jgi:hypothetical protein
MLSGAFSLNQSRMEEYMDKEVADAIAELKAQGITVAVDPSGRHADVYIATIPDGEKYEFASEIAATGPRIANLCERA